MARQKKPAVVTGKAAAALRRVKATILKYPQLIAMDLWVNGKVKGCGTVACIAGHIALNELGAKTGSEEIKIAMLPNPVRAIVKKELRDDDATVCDVREAVEAFLKHHGVKTDQQIGAYTANESTYSRLFFVSDWPSDFAADYHTAENLYDTDVAAIVKAQITAKRIDHFIQFGE